MFVNTPYDNGISSFFPYMEWYSTWAAHSQTFPSLHLRHNILQSFRPFTYVTAHSPTLPLLHLRHSSLSNPSFASPTSQAFYLIHLASRTELILQTFSHFTFVTTHSPTLPSLYLRHSSFFNPSVASPTSQFILQPFVRFSYVTSSSLNSPGEQSSFSNLSVTSPTSQFILQRFFRLSYITSSSLNSPGEPPMKFSS